MQQPLHAKILLFAVYAALLAILTQSLETDNAVNKSEQSIVLTDTNVHTGMDVSASLTDKDVACQNELTVSTLNAEALRFRVTAVLRGAAALFMGEELKTNFQHNGYTSKTSRLSGYSSRRPMR